MKGHKFIWILFLPVFVCNAQFKTNVYSAGIKNPVPGNINPTELNINPNALYKPAEAIIFYDDSLRFLYSYNSDGLLANETRAILIDNNWQEKSRYTYTYSSGYLSEIILKVYVYNNWSNAYRWSYNNDSNGNPLIQLVEGWAQTAWAPILKVASTYDLENHKLTDSIFRHINGSWNNFFDILYEYENSLLKTKTSLDIEVGATDRSTFTYDSEGKLILIFNDYLFNNVWVPSSRETFTYNSQLLISQLVEEWVAPEWVNYRKISYEYSNSNLIKITTDLWSGFWSYEEKTEYIYDDFGNAVLGEHFRWQNQWVPASGYVTMYFSGSGKIDYSTATWVQITYTNLTYSEEADIHSKNFFLECNYPNPFNPSTNISYQLAKESNVRILLHNILGEEIRVIKDEIQTAGEYSTRLTAESLPAGVYFYTLIAEPVDGTQVFRATKKMSLVK